MLAPCDPPLLSLAALLLPTLTSRRLSSSFCRHLLAPARSCAAFMAGCIGSSHRVPTTCAKFTSRTKLRSALRSASGDARCCVACALPVREVLPRSHVCTRFLPSVPRPAPSPTTCHATASTLGACVSTTRPISRTCCPRPNCSRTPSRTRPARASRTRQPPQRRPWRPSPSASVSRRGERG